MDMSSLTFPSLSTNELLQQFKQEKERSLAQPAQARPDENLSNSFLSKLNEIREELRKRGLEFEEDRFTIVPRHQREAERLKLLQDYQILDTIEEQDFDELTELASAICNVPVSLISLVDDDRQWFKSHYGLPESETPIEQSFCAHAIVAPEEIMIVENPALDERFKNNPLVTGYPHIGFYAGVPLIGDDNLPLGTLCIIDQQSRTLSVTQIKALKTLAKQVMTKLELRRKVALLKAAEQRLESANNELTLLGAAQKNIIQKQSDNLLQSYTDLQRSNEDLQQFAHVASHDLREPLRKIRLFSSRLREDEEFKKLSERAKQMVERIDTSVDRMQQMIDGVLSYSKNLSVEEDHVSVNLDEILASVLVDLELSIQAKSASISSGVLGAIKGSVTQLYQLFSNLLLNSLKFSNGSVKISVQADTFSENGKMFKRLIFSDNGIGFEQQYSNKIFETFTRLNSKDHYAGTGMGLSLCKKIAERHGGEISATGIIDEGAVFTVCLEMK